VTGHWNLVMAYAGFILAFLVIMFVVLGLLDRQMNRNDEQKRAKAAKELSKRLRVTRRTSSGTRIFWAIDDKTPDEDDPPTTRQYYDAGWMP
jgi:uncharacterized protein (DUF58 family)